MCIKQCLGYVGYVADGGSECGDFKHRRAMLPNAPAHRRRATGVRLSTETQSRRSVQPVCWAIIYSYFCTPFTDINSGCHHTYQ
jgi:hypothetical protein